MGVRRDGERVDLREDSPPVREEVAVRHLDGGLGRAIPVRPEHEGPPVVGVSGDPDVSDPTCFGDSRQVEGLARLDVDARRDLPSLSEVARGGRAGSFRRASTAPGAPSRFSGEIDLVCSRRSVDAEASVGNGEELIVSTSLCPVEWQPSAVATRNETARATAILQSISTL